jgi:ubiquinone/menaquinone biosynthesis C-methylase UbiE
LVFQLASHLIGDDYGDNPELKREQIAKDKAWWAEEIYRFMKLNRSSVGLEIGTGCGHIISRMADLVQFMYGVDVSPSYLAVAKQTCYQKANVDFAVILNGQLNLFDEQCVDFVYSNNVFIHLDFFEISEYLQQVHRILRPVGKLWFDIVDLDRVDFANNRDFQMSSAVKRLDPTNKNCIHFNSARALDRLLKYSGYKRLKVMKGKRCNTKMLYQKKSS